LEGSASNVVGLPMELLQSMLAEWDLSFELFQDSSSFRG
jgi:predicted house-cleaning NTP pyrophosphatase (Maf/HAM1 superfamily)